jgi:hypothetical protein
MFVTVHDAVALLRSPMTIALGHLFELLHHADLVDLLTRLSNFLNTSFGQNARTDALCAAATESLATASVTEEERKPCCMLSPENWNYQPCSQRSLKPTLVCYVLLPPGKKSLNQYSLGTLTIQRCVVQPGHCNPIRLHVLLKLFSMKGVRFVQSLVQPYSVISTTGL